MTLILLFHALSNGINYFILESIQQIVLLYLYNYYNNTYNNYTYIFAYEKSLKIANKDHIIIIIIKFILNFIIYLYLIYILKMI